MPVPRTGSPIPRRSDPRFRSRQAGEISRKYSTPMKTTIRLIFRITRFVQSVRWRTPSTSGGPAAGRRLSQLQHGRRTKGPFEPHHRHWQHSSWLVFALEPHHGSFNTATGAGALLFNTADENTAFGAAALLSNTTGIRIRPMALPPF